MPTLSKLVRPHMLLNRVKPKQIPFLMSLVLRGSSSSGVAGVNRVPEFYKKALEEGGTLIYERAISTDNRFDPPQEIAHNTWWRFFSWSLREKYELWPLVGFLVLWAAWFGFIATNALGKHEIQLDRSKPLPPWDWERERDHYYKTPNQIYYAGNSFEPKHQRNRILETLENEMIDAAKKKGSR